MEGNNIGLESILRNLKSIEAIVDEILTDVDALCELTDENGPLNQLLDNVLLTCQTPHSKTLKGNKDKRLKALKKMGKPHNNNRLKVSKKMGKPHNNKSLKVSKKMGKPRQSKSV